jgi:hypothetical protein
MQFAEGEMSPNEARQLTVKEREQGFIVCDCRKYAYVFSAAVATKLPQGYSGELCHECGLWMCSVERLKEGGVLQ